MQFHYMLLNILLADQKVDLQQVGHDMRAVLVVRIAFLLNRVLS